MSGMSAGFDAVIDTLDSARGGDTRTGLRMLDGGGSAARLVFASGTIPGPRLTITASGVLRPIDLVALRRWL